MATAQILTENAAGDGWIDNVPSAVSTGYQAQNTNITARSLGSDMTTVTVSDTEVTISQYSGSIDIDGVPFKMTEDKVFSIASIPSGASFFALTNGANDFEKNIALTTIAPTWSDVKYGYYTSSGERVLNWVITKDGSSVAVRRIGVAPSESYGIAGIGLGGRRVYTDETISESITIAKSGVYELFAISAGSYNIGDTTKFNGGGSVRVVARLSVGSVVNISTSVNVTTYSTIIEIPSQLTMTASILATSVISSSIPVIESEIYDGVVTFGTSDYGGNAGKYGDGNGSVDAIPVRYKHGFAEITWVSE